MKLEFKYFFLLLFPIVMILPFPLIVSSISLGAACLNLLTLTFVERKWERGNRGVFLILIGLYIVLLDSITGFLRGSFDINIKESRITFLIIPLVFWIGQNELREVRTKILEAVIVGVILYIFNCFGFLMYFYSFMTKRSFAFNEYLKYDLYNYLPGAYHHSYIGMYMTFSLIILTTGLVFKKNTVILFISLFIFSCQIFIGGNLSILLSFIVLGVFILKQINFKKSWNQWGLLIFLIALLGVGYKSGVFETVAFSTNNRFVSWECSINGFLNNPFLGLGDNTYTYMSNCIDSDANSSHNQYLSELVTYGIFGCWIFLLFPVSYLKFSKDEISKYFLFLIIIVCLAENILSLQRGILFFIFFTSLFMNTKPQND